MRSSGDIGQSTYPSDTRSRHVERHTRLPQDRDRVDTNGAGRARTDDLLDAIEALSQLSYSPNTGFPTRPLDRSGTLADRIASGKTFVDEASETWPRQLAGDA